MKIIQLEYKKVTGIQSWEEWLKVWGETTDQTRLIGMLHSGLDSKHWPDEMIKARIEFYFSVANNWMVYKGEKQKVAEKAFLVVMHFLNKATKQTFTPSYILGEWMLKSLSAFFYAKHGVIHNLPSLSGRPDGNDTERFLIYFCSHMYDCSCMPREFHENLSTDTWQTLQDIIPWILEMMFNLRKLDTLPVFSERYSFSDDISLIRFKLSKAGIRKLIEISLRTELPPRENGIQTRRKAKNIAEAVLANSPAALLLIRYKYSQKALRMLTE